MRLVCILYLVSCILRTMKRALITGGAGFVGSHLATTLLEKEWSVEIIDDLSTGSLDNVAHLKEYPQFTSIIDSVMNHSLMEELVDQTDVVFHLAAAVGVRLIVEQPVQTIETNIKATEVILELTARDRKPILLASTSEVYGKLDRPPFNEENDLVLGATSRVRWCYAASKIIDEFLAQAYYREKGLPIVVVRLFNSIGPRQTGQYGMVVPRFVQQALQGEPITVYGDGTQQRSFTWVGDVVGAMIALVSHPGAHGKIFNVGHGKEISMYGLAELIKKMTNSESEIKLVPYDEAYEAGFEDMQRRLPDLSKIRQLIGYEPTLDLPEILDRTIQHERGKAASNDVPL